MRTETVITGDFSMDYFKFGCGDEVFVILPGLSVQSVMNSADAVAEAYGILTKRCTVYVFDRRKELPDTYSVFDMAADTAAALTALGIGKATVFGASQGGMIAAVMAAEYPELVENLILGSASAEVSDKQYQTVKKWIRLAKENNAYELYLSFGKALYPKETFERLRGALTDAAKTVTEKELMRFTVLARALKGFDAADELKKISCPTLILGSDDDRVLGADASLNIAKNLNKDTYRELYMYHGCGHAAYDTAANYKERILNFLTR